MLETEEVIELDQEHFDREVAEAGCLEDLTKLYNEKDYWWDPSDENASKLFDRVLSFITDLDKAISFWDAGYVPSTQEQDNQLLERMVELIQTTDDLKGVFDRVSEFYGWEDEALKRRGLFRKLFDKADGLGYPTI